MLKQLQHIFVNRKIQHALFLLVSTLLAWIYVGGIINKGPVNTHLWRQTDCLSMTKNMMDGGHLFQPEMHIQLGNDLQSGKSAGEFPILYWIVGNIWKVTGESMTVYRLFYLLILLGGVYALFLSAEPFLNSFFLSSCFALTLFFSPVYLFYGISFITDGPAFAFALMGIYFLIRYSLYHNQLKQKGKFAFWISMLCFSLVGLLKISSLIPFVFVLLLFGLELVGINLLNGRKIFRRSASEFAGITMVFVLIFTWYAYASYYNAQTGFKYTFNHIFPFWLTDQYELDTLLRQVQELTLPVFSSKWTLFILGVIWLVNFYSVRKNPVLLTMMNLFIPIGVGIYIALWFPLFGVHDYYYMPLVILFPAILFPFFLNIAKHWKEMKNKKWGIGGLLCIFMLWNFLYINEVHTLKSGGVKSNSNIIISNSKFVDNMNWTNHTNEQEVYQFLRIRNHLNKFGIAEHDKVIVLSDVSFNISLYLMNRKGWTNFKQYDTLAELEHLIEQGKARHLLILQRDLDKFEFASPLMERLTGKFEDLYIYQLAPKT